MKPAKKIPGEPGDPGLSAMVLTFLVVCLALIFWLIWVRASSVPDQNSVQEKRSFENLETSSDRPPNSSNVRTPIELSTAKEGVPASQSGTDSREVIKRLHDLSIARKNENAEDIGKLLGFFLEEPKAVEFLLDQILLKSLDEDEQENVLWIFSSIFRLTGASSNPIELQKTLKQRFTPWIERLVSNAELLPSNMSREILEQAIELDLLDESHLLQVSSLAQEDELYLVAVNAIVKIATKAKPIRLDLLEPLLNGKDSQARTAALLGLIKVDPQEGAERLRIALIEFPNERLSLISASVQIFDPDRALGLLIDYSRTANMSEEANLIHLFSTVSSKGGSKLVFERFQQEQDPKTRKLLVVAGRKDTELLQIAAEFDSNYEVRGQALTLLGAEKPDESTAELLSRSLRRLVENPTGKQKSPITEEIMLLGGIENFANSAPALMFSQNTVQRIIDDIEAIRMSSHSSEGLKKRATHVLDLIKSKSAKK